jgi:PAS domain S-box-containing protein
MHSPTPASSSRELIDKLLLLERTLQHSERALAEHDFIEKLLLTVDVAPVLLSYVDTSERYRFCNQTYERWFGTSRERIVGQTLREVLGAEAYEGVRAQAQAALSGQVVHFERTVPYRAGGTRVVRADYLPHVLPDGRVAGFVGMVADITERRSRMHADRLHAVSAALSQVMLPEEVARTVVAAGALALEAVSASLVLVSEDGTAFELRAAHGFPEEVKSGWRHFPIDSPVMFRDAVRTGGPVLYGDLEGFLRSYPELANSPALLGRAFAALPLRVDGRIIGAFGFTFAHERVFEPEDVQFMELLGQQCALALERARLYEAERQARAEAERLRDQLAAERGLLEAVLRQLPVGVIIAEPGGRYLLGNTAFESILRHPFKASEDLPGDGVPRGYRPDGTVYQPDEWPLMRSLRQGETVVREPVRFLHADGSRTEIELSSAPVRDAEGRTVAGVVVATDVSAHHQLQEALRREADVRDKLMGIVSHDLRGPLQAIAASGELLRTEALSPAQQKRVARIQTSVRRMDHLIRDLLDFVRVRQEGTLPIQRGQASLQETCRAVLDEVQAAHPGRQLLFEARGDTRGEWDASRLAQLVGNLVNNALKHGAEEAPVQTRVDGSGADVVLEVVNQGAPIPPELLPRIFEPFTRASTGGDALKGVGLGLFIVHEIVTAHGGHIEVRSTAELGTVFRVGLPRSLEA